MPAFDRYVGIDYSGAQTPDSRLTGLRVYLASRESDALEVLPPAGAGKYWTRRGIAYWLAEELRKKTRCVVGIDHAFSFPLRYFELHHLPLDWQSFLEDFQLHWPTHERNARVECVRQGRLGRGAQRSGNSRWRRLTDVRTTAKSVFHYDVPGSVAKSTHAGLPWLLYLRKHLGRRIHCWPFDGWRITAGRSVIVEAYPSLWSGEYARADRTADQHDAFAVATWLRDTDGAERLLDHFTPALTAAECSVAQVEGWILGVP